MKSEQTLVAKVNQATRADHWRNAQEAFFDANSGFRNPIAHGALDAALRMLYADPKYAGADYSYLLNKAADLVNQAFGIVPASPAGAEVSRSANDLTR